MKNNNIYQMRKQNTISRLNILFILFISLIGVNINIVNAQIKKKQNISFNKSKQKKTEKVKFDYLINKITSILKDEHYHPKKIDDSFSIFVYNEMIERLDFDKIIFYQRDIDFLNKYKTHLDEAWNTKNYTFLYTMDFLFNLRLKESKNLFEELVVIPFNYNEADSIYQNIDSFQFVKNLQEKKQRIKTSLKYWAIERYNAEIETRSKQTYIDSITGKLVSKDTAFVIKTDSTIERETRKNITKIFANRFIRLSPVKFSLTEKFNLFLTKGVEYFDPHTNYLPPADKREFNESMSKKFFGIGALLKEEEFGIKIEKVFPGGSAFDSKKVQSGDIILKVGENGKNMTDLVGYNVFEAVKLIRGADSTVVTLVIKHPNGVVETLNLFRREIKTDEALVKSALIKEGDVKIGYIYIPDFYSDFTNSDKMGAKSYIDMANELDKLNNEHIDGLIVDLRNNGGGSLYDVVQMVGFFIFDGPVVQIKAKNGEIGSLNDDNKWVLYQGPLTVMVNEFSASASEIFAAAIQDYKRGIITGSSSTYGKGTVQKTSDIPIPLTLKDTAIKDLGLIKYTIQKFYRINGESTQIKGVVPDIIIPDRYEYSKSKEQNNKTALPYDHIEKGSYKEWIFNVYNTDSIKVHSYSRIQHNPYFNAIKESSQWFDNVKNTYKPLDLTKYKKNEQEFKLKIAELDSSYAKIKNDTVFVTLMDIDKNKFKDVDKDSRNKEWANALRKDMYLIENVKIMKEIINKNQPEIKNKK